MIPIPIVAAVVYTTPPSISAASALRRLGGIHGLASCVATAITPAAIMPEQNADTIRILQRGNAMLRRRFGIDWADAASVVFAEAQRRGASPVALARVLTAGLRRDAKGRSA